MVAIEPKTRVETTQIGIFEILLRDSVMIDKIMNNIVLVFASGEAVALAQGSDGIPHDGLTLEARRGGVGAHGRENCLVGLCFDFLSKREVEESIGRPAPRACWGSTMGRVQGLWYFIAVAGTSGGQGLRHLNTKVGMLLYQVSEFRIEDCKMEPGQGVFAKHDNCRQNGKT